MTEQRKARDKECPRCGYSMVDQGRQWLCTKCCNVVATSAETETLTEQRTKPMSDERLKGVFLNFLQIAPVGELLAEVKRLRSQETNLVHGAVDLAEEMKAENARLRQEVERLRADDLKAMRDAGGAGIQEYSQPHPDTLLLDKLEAKVKGGWLVEINYVDLQDPWFELTLRGLHGETEKFEGPTIRSVAALEEK